MSFCRNCGAFARRGVIAMRRALLLCVVCLVPALALLAAAPVCAHVSTRDGGWVWPEPSATGQQPHLRRFSGRPHGWAVGDGGTILATTDGGAHWSVQTRGPTSGSLRCGLPRRHCTAGRWAAPSSPPRRRRRPLAGADVGHRRVPLQPSPSPTRHARLGGGLARLPSCATTRRRRPLEEAEAGHQRRHFTPSPSPTPRTAGRWVTRALILATSRRRRPLEEAASGTDRSLCSVTFPDTEHGWAVGYD